MKGVAIASSEEHMNRREFLMRVMGLGGAGLALMFVAACGGEDDDDDEGGDD
jgi:hypothetical protein